MRLTRPAAVAGLTAVSLLLVAAAFALTRAVDLSRYSGTIEATMSARLHRPVSIGRVRVDLPRLAVRADDVRVGEDPAFQTDQPFARIEQLTLKVKARPLLSGRVELRSVELHNPTFEFVRGADGAWNVATLARAGGEPQDVFSVDRLVVSGGVLGVTRRRPPDSEAAVADDASPRATFRDVDVEVRSAGNGRVAVTASTVAADQAGGRLKLSGHVGPRHRDTPMPFDGTVECQRLSIADVRRMAGMRASDVTDALLSGTATVRRDGSRLSAKGAMQLDAPRVRGLALGYPVAAEFDAEHDAAIDAVAIKAGTLRLNQTPVDITGSIRMAPAPPVVDLHVRIADGSLTEAARLSSAFGVAFAAGTHVQGRVSADLDAEGPFDAPAVEGLLRMRDVSVSGPDIPKPVRTDAIELTLTRNEIRARDFTLVTNGTSLGVRCAVRDYATKATIDASVRATRAGIGELLNIARAWGFEAVDGVSGAGVATVDVRAVGPRKQLAYSGSATMADATLTVKPLTKPLRVRTASVTFTGDSARFDNLHASIGGTTLDGQATVRGFDAPKVTFQLSADTVDIVALQQLLPAAPQAAPRGQAGHGEGDSLLRRTTGSGRVRVGSMANGPLVLNDVDTTVALDRGVVRLDPLTGRLFGGRCRGSVVADSTREPTAVAIRARLEQVDSDRLASAMFDMPGVIHGALASDVRVAFATGSVVDLARSLNGTFSMNIPNGRLAGMDLVHEVTNIARLAAGERVAGTTSVTSMKGSFTVVNGIASTSDLTASIDGGRIGAKGTMNLVSKALNMRVTAVLSREFSRTVGGTRVGGYMATVLANQQGELVVPMQLTGTFQHPDFAPDAAAIADMRLRNLVPTLTNPQTLGSAILGILGRKPVGEAGEEPTEPEPPATEQPEERPQPTTPEAAKPGAVDPRERLQQVLEELLGGRKPDQPPAPK